MFDDTTRTKKKIKEKVRVRSEGTSSCPFVVKFLRFNYYKRPLETRSILFPYSLTPLLPYSLIPLLPYLRVQ